jgi:hypothetical protein
MQLVKGRLPQPFGLCNDNDQDHKYPVMPVTTGIQVLKGLKTAWFSKLKNNDNKHGFLQEFPLEYFYQEQER